MRLGNNIKRTSLTEEILLFKYNTSTTNNEKRNFLRKEEVKKSQYVIIILYIILVNTMFHNFEEITKSCFHGRSFDQKTYKCVCIMNSRHFELDNTQTYTNFWNSKTKIVQHVYIRLRVLYY